MVSIIEQEKVILLEQLIYCSDLNNNNEAPCHHYQVSLRNNQIKESMKTIELMYGNYIDFLKKAELKEYSIVEIMPKCTEERLHSAIYL